MVEFCWGHDHDFGSFKLEGEMGTRHLWMLSRFFDHFDISPSQLKDQDVLDIGAWTGGVSLILNRLGARVTAIDEIQKYVSSLNYLAESFGLDSFKANPKSLYDLGEPEYLSKYDTVFCLGVIYHLSDPVIGLRRIYNSLKPGGLLCIESMSIPSKQAVCDYEGPSRRRGNFGWNWFVPSPKAIYQLLQDTGFIDIKVGNGLEEFKVTAEGDPMGSDRCFAVARKNPDHQICSAGLSVQIK